ncbi:hypothetical protein GGF37_002145 [Kickxella alabastrina]|nr:hypothetical protein GGF37_002145 [Kickxella alabastrina]
MLAAIAVFAASTVVSAYPIYGYYPGYGGVSQSSYHNSGAYDNGVSTSASPYSSNSNSWNSGFAAKQSSNTTPYGNSGSSSYNQWNSNAYSNQYGGYPRYW